MSAAGADASWVYDIYPARTLRVACQDVTTTFHSRIFYPLRYDTVALGVILTVMNMALVGLAAFQVGIDINIVSQTIPESEKNALSSI